MTINAVDIDMRWGANNVLRPAPVLASLSITANPAVFSWFGADSVTSVGSAFGISSVTGTISDGNSITISGSGFGTKTTAAPFHYDDFEGGTSGNDLSAPWEAYATPGEGMHKYSNVRAYKGSQSALRDATLKTGDDFRSTGLKNMNATSAYYSLWTYMEGTNTGVMKVFRTASDPAGEFYFLDANDPGLYITRQGSWVYAGWATSAGTDQRTLGGSESANLLPFDQWNKIEVYVEYSDAGVANGTVLIWINGTEYYGADGDIATRGTGQGASVIDNFLIPGMDDDTSCDIKWYVDQVYVDTTPKRVEIGNAATYAACTVKTPSPATAWADGSITVTLNTAGLSLGTNYVYILDDTNTPIETDGYAITVV